MCKNCAEIYKSGETADGVYTIKPDNLPAFDVFCDQTTAGGGWTVFQERLDGSVDFFLDWSDYKVGFGDLNGEFWLGLDKIHHLTSNDNSMLRVDLEDFEGNTAYAEYNMFSVMNENDKYKLILGNYSGDSLSFLSLCLLKNQFCTFLTTVIDTTKARSAESREVNSSTPWRPMKSFSSFLVIDFLNELLTVIQFTSIFYTTICYLNSVSHFTLYMYSYLVLCSSRSK